MLIEILSQDVPDRITLVLEDARFHGTLDEISEVVRNGRSGACHALGSTKDFIQYMHYAQLFRIRETG